MSFGRGLIEREWRRRHPFPQVLTWADYRAVLATPPFQHGTTRLFGQPVRFSNQEGLLHSIRELFCDEVYRFRAVREDPRIIDAGANIGLSVIYFKRLYPLARIVAYEPDKALFELLRYNVGAYSDVDLHEAAAWTSDGTLTFYSEGSLAGSTEIDFANFGKATVVRSERLLDQLAGEPVDFLKIDIEGAENSVLFDVADELSNVQHLFFEYHSVPGKDQQLGDLLNLVRSAGFRYSINGAHGARLPFVETLPHGFDLQLNVFCFRPADTSK